MNMGVTTVCESEFRRLTNFLNSGMTALLQPNAAVEVPKDKEPRP